MQVPIPQAPTNLRIVAQDDYTVTFAWDWTGDPIPASGEEGAGNAQFRYSWALEYTAPDFGVQNKTCWYSYIQYNGQPADPAHPNDVATLRSFHMTPDSVNFANGAIGNGSYAVRLLATQVSTGNSDAYRSPASNAVQVNGIKSPYPSGILNPRWELRPVLCLVCDGPVDGFYPLESAYAVLYDQDGNDTILRFVPEAGGAYHAPLYKPGSDVYPGTVTLTLNNSGGGQQISHPPEATPFTTTHSISSVAQNGVPVNVVSSEGSEPIGSALLGNVQSQTGI